MDIELHNLPVRQIWRMRHKWFKQLFVPAATCATYKKYFLVPKGERRQTVYFILVLEEERPFFFIQKFLLHKSKMFHSEYEARLRSPSKQQSPQKPPATSPARNPIVSPKKECYGDRYVPRGDPCGNCKRVTQQFN